MPATFIKSLTDLKDFPKSDKPQIAFFGRSNVGKSSLLNHLTGEKDLARVSATPGRTQTINVFDMNKKYLLVDLPGYGFAKTARAKRLDFEDMLNRYLWQAKNLTLAVVIIDARLGPTDLDREMLGILQANNIPFTIVANKADKLNASETLKLKRTLDEAYPATKTILHSNVTGGGRGDILQAIEKAVR